MPSSPRLLLLCGLPFSGKSTMSRALRERLGVVHVEVDRYVDRSVEPERRGDHEAWLPAYRMAMAEIRANLAAGRSVVFDAVGHRRTHRRRMERLASSLGATMTIIHMDVSEAEAWTRLLGNRADPVRLNVPDEGFARIATEMERPDADELALDFRPPEPLEEWIDRMVKPLFERDGS